MIRKPTANEREASPDGVRCRAQTMRALHTQPPPQGGYQSCKRRGLEFVDLAVVEEGKGAKMTQLVRNIDGNT